MTDKPKVSRLRRLWRGLFVAGLRLSGALLQVVSALVVARFAAPEQAGYYFIGFALATIVAVLGRAGFDQALTRFVASDLALDRAPLAWKTCQHLTRRFLLRMAVACPVLAAACGLAMTWPVLHEQAAMARALLPFVVAAPFLGVAALSGMALQASGRSLASVASMFYIQNVVVMATAAAPAAWIQQGAFAYAFLAGCMLAALLGLVAVRRRFRDAAAMTAPADAWTLTRQPELRALVRDNTWTVIGNLALTWGPTTLLGALSTPVEAARFGVANRSAQLVSFAVPALNFVLAPRFAAQAATHQHAALRRTLITSIVLSLVLCTLVAAPMIGLAPDIMRFFGEAYASSAGVLVLLVLAQWATGAAGATIQFLLMTGGEKVMRRLFVGTLLVALPAGVPLVALYGASGAAMLSLGACLGLNLSCAIAALLRARPHCAPPGCDMSLLAPAMRAT